MDPNFSLNGQWFQNHFQMRQPCPTKWTSNLDMPKQSWIQKFGNPITNMENKDSFGESQKNLDDPWSQIDAQSAFLGPSLWDQSDFMVDYSALDEFLIDSGLTLDGIPSPLTEEKKILADANSPLMKSPDSQPLPAASSSITVSPLNSDLPLAAILDLPLGTSDSLSGSSSKTCVSFSESDLALVSQPGQDFDPRTSSFPPDDLRPHRMLKKSRKRTIPEDVKDDRYWEKRQKNNLAAKKSRDARRLKENQIIMRASFLERENAFLRAELEKVNKDNVALSQRLQKYEPV